MRRAKGETPCWGQMKKATPRWNNLQVHDESCHSKLRIPGMMLFRKSWHQPKRIKAVVHNDGHHVELVGCSLLSSATAINYRPVPRSRSSSRNIHIWQTQKQCRARTGMGGRSVIWPVSHPEVLPAPKAPLIPAFPVPVPLQF